MKTNEAVARRLQHRRELKARLSRLLSGPRSVDQEFVVGQWTFGAVYDLAEKLRAALDPGEPVCLLVEDKGVMAAAVLAALAGGPSLVLPFAFSHAALKEIQAALGVRRALVDRMRPLPAGFESLCALQAPAGTKGKGWPTHVDLDREMLQIFTGGSTGRPKNWTKSVDNLFSEAFFHARRMAVGPEDRIVATVPAYHIYGLLFSVLVPLLAEAAVTEAVCTFPQEIRTALADLNPTILVSVPVHYRVLTGSTIPRGSLRLALSSAGALDPMDGRYFFEQTGVGVTEVFGSTETGGIATRCRPSGETAFRPFDVLEWKIRDGRLCVRSDFISPALPVDADGFFMTGDRAAAVSPNGFVLRGRADGIVKIGGKRVDLEEVAGRIRRVPGVREVVVTSLAGGGGRENDIAALVAGSIAKGELLAALAPQLEGYAMPRRVLVVDAIPALSTGKYDREAIKNLLDRA